MNFVSLFLIGVAALFNVAWHHPEALPTVYQLTLASVQHVVCDISSPSAQHGSVCNLLDDLRLPSAPVVLTIAAPDSDLVPWWAQQPVLDANNSLPAASKHLDSPVVSTALIHVPTESESSTPQTPPDWLHEATDIVLALLWLVLMSGLVILIYGTIWFKVDGSFENVIRGLTWMFCGPLPVDRSVNTTAQLAAPVSTHVVALDNRDFGSGDVPRPVLAVSSSPRSPLVPERLVAEVPRSVVVPTPEAEPRKRVRCAARCQRIRKQKAKARESQQEPAVEHPESEQSQTNPDEPRRGSRGGKQVRKRQRKQELKAARRAEANAEAGPSSASIAAPTITDNDEFPPLRDIDVQADPIQFRVSFAAVVATGAPSPSAAIRRGSWSVKVNSGVERPQVEGKRRAIDGVVEESREEWLDLDEEAWRKGRRKKNKD
ncbi:hypothetical protein BC629DRAFT_1435641 [Irpex lacteus]|nr:hypothetical protein BC629DRAFT_1435641 [Irpex lacteus]